MSTTSMRRPAAPAGVPALGDITFRTSTDLEADLAGLFAAQDAARVADGEADRNDLQGFSNFYRHLERCDPATDLLVAEADGRIVAYTRVEWSDSNDGERWYEAVGVVHPEWRRRGIGTRLLAWSEARRLAIASSHAGEAPERAITTFILDGDTGGRVLLTGAGYVAFRRFATMRRPDLDAIDEVPLPDGLEIRPIPRDRAAMRQVYDADCEAFRDHFGSVDGSDEGFEALLGFANVDPARWIVAFDGDEVAGAVMGGIHVSPDGERSGWLDTIFTRRPWRRRGLARALIARSLADLRDQGLADASLGVDLTNPHQALALYESCGFRVVSSATAFRKPLPDRSSAPEEVS